MKKPFVISLIIGFIVVVGVGFVYFTQLRGIWPVFGTPQQTIVDVLPETPQAPTVDEYKPLALPKEFIISIFAKELGAPRVLALDPTGTVVVSIPERGTVVALPDNDNNGVADESVVIAQGLRQPHGIAFDCQNDDCQLYVAQTNQVTVFDYNTTTRQASNGRAIVDLPAGGRHWSRTIRVEDDTILITIGSSCDTCREEHPYRAAMVVAKKDGSQPRVFASGLRNTVFFTRHPVTGKIWGTDMGRDLLGDDIPPDEVNIITDGGNYGWPICYGQNIHDTVFDKNIYIKNPCELPQQIPAHIDLPAHSAPLGLAFVPEEGWPEAYWHDLLIAYHGSWNRTTPTGYKIVRVDLDATGGQVGEVTDFVSGWLVNAKESLGRPVDILLLPGGVGYISDDKAGVIYRLGLREQP